MPAKLRVERLADLVVLQSRDRLLELGGERSRSRPTQITALGRGSRVLGSCLGEPRELLALENPLAQCRELLPHGRIVGELGGLHEDVPYVDLVLHGLAAGAAHLIQPDDVVSGRRAQRLAHLAGFESGDHVGKERGQLAALAPAKRAALEGGLAARVGYRELGEILAALGALINVRGALGRLVELREARFLGHGDQDVRHVVLVALGGGLGLLLEELVDLARRDADVLQHIPLAQQRERDLLAEVLTVGGVVFALLREGVGQLRERQAVALRHVLQRGVHGLVRYLDAGVIGALDLDLLQYQALEHLLAQDVLRRQFELLLAQPHADDVHLRLELAVEHDAVIHDRCHAVEQLTLGGQLAGLRVRRLLQGEGRRHYRKPHQG